MEALGKLFGSVERVKIMRLFIWNGEATLEVSEVAKRSKSSALSTRRELTILTHLKFLKFKKDVGYQLNSSFPYLPYLRSLLNSDIGRKRRDISDRFRRCGRIRLIIIAGLFIHADDSRADLVIVGDSLRRGLIEKAIKTLEAEIGRELNYAVFETGDFSYRLEACDKFVRDVLDYPHEKIIDKLSQ